MLTALLIIVAVAVIGLLLWRVMERPKPGQAPLDAQGRAAIDKPISPEARHQDALGQAIHAGVNLLFSFANQG